MIIMATGAPDFDVKGEHIILTIPSGKDKIQIALSRNDLMRLDHEAHKAVIACLEHQHSPKAACPVVAFPHAARRR